MGDLSLNFSRSEFVCHHCGRRVGPSMALVDVLQRMRTSIGVPLRIVSGYRCKAHNVAVDGFVRSHHLTGEAADVPRGLITVALAQASGARGIGVRDGWVIHVDAGPWPRVVFAD